ncbi:MAG: FlgB family protein [Gemmobacter sp.]
MLPKLELTRMAQAMAAQAGARMGVIAQNLANADTPGYKARDLPDFAATWREADPMRATRAGHFGVPERPPTPEARIVPATGAPNGNTVSLEGEMVKAAEARQSHEMALAIYRSTSDLVRSALGRGR